MYEVDIYSPTVTRSDVGSSVTTWSKTYSTRAKVIFGSGARGVEQNEVLYNYVKTFIVRQYVPVTEFDRIYFQGKYYRIISIDDRREFYDKEIVAELVNE